MEVKFTVTKEERKALVKAIGEFVGLAPVYLGAPSFKFAVGACIIDKDGLVVFDEGTSTEDIRSLLTEMAERGFVFEGELDEIASVVSEPTEVAEDECVKHAPISDDTGKLSINMPLAGFTASSIDNLEKLIAAKAWIIKKMTGADELPIERDEKYLLFPWFKKDASAAEIDTYSRLIAGLCETAKTKQRDQAKENQIKEGDNEKFKARCFLLSLNFIGKDSAQARKILLAPMSGSGAFKSGERKKPGAPSGATNADSGEKSDKAIHVREGADSALNADNAAVPPRCGECWHHCYYTDGLMRTKAGDIVDTSNRAPDSHTHYCLNAPSGYRKIKHAVDWTGLEASPKWCPLNAGSGEKGANRDCLACANALSEPAADGEEFDKLFCVVKQDYVSEDGSCGEFNS